LVFPSAFAADHLLFQIGQPDGRNAEFALAPAGYRQFTNDAFFLVGESTPARDWPYVQPGPSDAWAGSRPHTFSMLFGATSTSAEGRCRLVLDLLDTQNHAPPTLRLQLNGEAVERALPPGAGDRSIQGEPGAGKPCQVAVEFPARLLKPGNNRLDITTTAGSWVLYDAVSLYVPEAVQAGALSDFTTLAAVEASPVTLERDGNPVKRITATILHAGPPVDATLKLDEEPLQSLRLNAGRETAELFVPAPSRARKATLALLAGSSVARQELGLTPGLREVVVVFKTHFDIGYTDMASNIVQKYRTTMIDQALEVVDQNRDLPPAQQFVWTLSGWPMHKILEEWPRQTTARLLRLEKAITDGRFAVHALPFSTHTELLEPEDLVRGLGFSSRIARRFGLELPHDAKMTDVPEHTWMMATLLHHAGVRFMHIGCNGASASPEVPPLYWWQGPDGSRVLTMYSPQYGTGLLPPSDWPYSTWLALQHTGDNHGPPRPEEVKRVLAQLAEKLPGVKVRIGRLSDFGDAILTEKPDLPVVAADTPDTWIHGPMSDPAGARLARNTRPLIAATESLNTQLLLWRFDVTNAAPAINHAYEQSLLYGEHTWGGSIGWLGGHFGFGEEFKKERATGRFDRIEGSWDEHSAYIKSARELIQPVLEQNLKTLAQSVSVPGRRIVVYNPLPWKRTGIVTVTGDPTGVSALKPVDPGAPVPVLASGSNITFLATDVPPMGYRTFLPTQQASTPVPELRADYTRSSLESPAFKAVLDFSRGVIRSLTDKRTGRELVDSSAPHGFGQYLYERFDSNQVHQYMVAYLKHRAWSVDFDKPGLPPADKFPYQAASPANFKLRFEQTPLTISAVMEAPAGAGVPNPVTTRLTLYRDLAYADLEITLHEKPLDSWPEAGWLCLPFKITEPQFRLGRLGSIIDPTRDIVPGANHYLFGINTGVAIVDAQGAGVAFCPLDSPLVSLDTPGCWKFSPDFIPRKPVAYLNLFNNQWNTNFRLWNSGTWTSRIRLWSLGAPASSPAILNAALANPSLEARYPLLAAYDSGSAAKPDDKPPATKPATQPGLSLSRQGVLVTALGENPDGDGAILRLWELAGQSGDCRVEFPAGAMVKSVSPVDLRGRANPQPIRISGHTFVVHLNAFAPASYQLK
jgi:hypothetical protein